MKSKYAIVVSMVFLVCTTFQGAYSFATKARNRTDVFTTVQVPILCYHNIRERKKESDPLLTISPEEFLAQITFLHDSGYHTIAVEELTNYIKNNQRLPAKTVLITFDDAHAEDYYIAMPVLKKFNFTGVFFINTICLNKKTYLNDEQVKELSLNGNTIGAHTWDHPNLASAASINWNQQLLLPKQRLERITGKVVEVFAYPYGCWNRNVIDSLQHYGYKGAFQLNGKQDKLKPVYTIRRIMCSGLWSTKKLQEVMQKQFE